MGYHVTLEELSSDLHAHLGPRESLHNPLQMDLLKEQIKK